MNDEPIDELDLLSLCAIMRRFDRHRLRTLAAADDQRIDRFLASDHVEALPHAPGCYQLQPQLRARALTQLRAARPKDEVALHTRAFDYFLAQMRDAARAAGAS